MLKKLIITSTLLLGSTSQLSAASCVSYHEETRIDESTGQDSSFFFV